MSKDIRIIREDCCDIWNNLKDKTQMIDYLIESKQQIADLEAKLAEKERDFDLLMLSKNEEINEWIAVRDDKNKVINRQTDKIQELRQQLAEKEKEIEKITKIVAYKDDMDRSTIINGVKFTNEQIITLQNIDYFADKHNQDKISFAVEQLEKVKGSVQAFDGIELIGFIDNQISELKKGVE